MTINEHLKRDIAAVSTMQRIQNQQINKQCYRRKKLIQWSGRPVFIIQGLQLSCPRVIQATTQQV